MIYVSNLQHEMCEREEERKSNEQPFLQTRSIISFFCWHACCSNADVCLNTPMLNHWTIACTMKVCSGFSFIQSQWKKSRRAQRMNVKEKEREREECEKKDSGRKRGKRLLFSDQSFRSLWMLFVFFLSWNCFTVRFCTCAIQCDGENKRNNRNKEIPRLIEIPNFCNFHQNKRCHSKIQCKLCTDPSDDRINKFCDFILLKMWTNCSSNSSSSISFNRS